MLSIYMLNLYYMLGIYMSSEDIYQDTMHER